MSCLEASHSGLVQRFRKPPRCKSLREFESLRFRNTKAAGPRAGGFCVDPDYTTGFSSAGAAGASGAIGSAAGAAGAGVMFGSTAGLLLSSIVL